MLIDKQVVGNLVILQFNSEGNDMTGKMKLLIKLKVWTQKND